MFLPFWWVKLTASHFKRDIAAELETALSIITTAYLRNEDILTAVEENIAYLNPPVLSVFKGFVSRVRLVDPDVTAALHDLKDRIDNAVYAEWCDALIACQHDRSLKTTAVLEQAIDYTEQLMEGEPEPEQQNLFGFGGLKWW